jgi:glutaredoxin
MKVEIYGTSWCGYCNKAKELCEELEVEYNYVDVDNTANLRQLEERIGEKVKSVPQIFLNGSFLSGGFAKLQEVLVKS